MVGFAQDSYRKRSKEAAENVPDAVLVLVCMVQDILVAHCSIPSNSSEETRVEPSTNNLSQPFITNVIAKRTSFSLTSRTNSRWKLAPSPPGSPSPAGKPPTN